METEDATVVSWLTVIPIWKELRSNHGLLILTLVDKDHADIIPLKELLEPEAMSTFPETILMLSWKQSTFNLFLSPLLHPAATTDSTDQVSWTLPLAEQELTTQCLWSATELKMAKTTGSSRTHGEPAGEREVTKELPDLLLQLPASAVSIQWCPTLSSPESDLVSEYTAIINLMSA